MPTITINGKKVAPRRKLNLEKGNEKHPPMSKREIKELILKKREELQAEKEQSDG